MRSCSTNVPSAVKFSKPGSTTSPRKSDRMAAQGACSCLTGVKPRGASPLVLTLRLVLRYNIIRIVVSCVKETTPRMKYLENAVVALILITLAVSAMQALMRWGFKRLGWNGPYALVGGNA